MLVSQSLQGCLVVGVASVSAGFVILKNRKVNFYQVLPVILIFQIFNFMLGYKR
jgi:hypothetical protein